MRLASMLAIAFLWAAPSAVPAADNVYVGEWHTTNRKLDGTMTCVATLGNDNWRGRFYGVWQGVNFDYTVDFSGPPEALRGQATIDGANYDWTGTLSGQSPRTFQGQFGGSRYAGHFKLTEQPSR
jgi:hypothetical protein